MRRWSICASSRHIVLHDLVVTARGSRYRSFVRIPDSRDVTIRDSDFSHCGDRSPKFADCVLLWRWSHDVVIAHNRFHDCRGCDFVHGRFGSNLTIRRNRFDRSLPCGMDAYRCGHQDLVQLFAGNRPAGGTQPFRRLPRGRRAALPDGRRRPRDRRQQRLRGHRSSRARATGRGWRSSSAVPRRSGFPTMRRC